jgi:hypothetical protein
VARSQGSKVSLEWRESVLPLLSLRPSALRSEQNAGFRRFTFAPSLEPFSNRIVARWLGILRAYNDGDRAAACAMAPKTKILGGRFI